ncbi:MAG: hypothetical protein J0I40_02095 [Cellulomonas sp.]|uniref:hypothetical protein n=1 Tax=Cellulomonas sp. 73-92 TaxID=1895740 RepID=UPI00092C0B27|nr:hypothetical protein [Cellulomonas sp. 73-92]MBN9374185.1 hypothetical protein [Cellulomonas sp.]OJV81483.1 MAG: hypothetical protein BGO37_05945 [Cellulomonas sp. 73-92]
MVALGLVVPALAGCGVATGGTGGGGSCVGPSGQVPTSAAPGETVTIPLTYLWDPNDCHDTSLNGETWPPRTVLTQVTAELRGPCSAGAPVVASDTTKVNDDADHTATVHLAVPTDAHGVYWVLVSGNPVGGINVGLDPAASATNVGFDPTACAMQS